MKLRKEREQVKKRDLLLILSVVLIAAALLAVMMIGNSGKTAKGQMKVYVDGKLYDTVTIVNGRDYEVKQEDGSVNVIRMTENGFYMLSSTCHNQLCIEQGEANADNWNKRSLGTHVICLPNRVDVELELTADKVVLDPDAPDV